MIHALRAFILLALAWPATGILAETYPVEQFMEARIVKNIEYARIDGFRPLLLDLYLPKNGPSGKPAPVVIYIHGGGFRGGRKEDPPGWIELNRHGYAVASVQYRLTGEERFPAQIHDVKAAVRWVRAMAGEYGLDPAHVGAWGSSAGGHLAALVGTSGGVAALEGEVGSYLDQSSVVQAVVDWFGPTDFLRIEEQSIGGDPEARVKREIAHLMLLGCPAPSCPGQAKAASPIAYVSADDPPFLIMHGKDDGLVPAAQSELLERALSESGVSVELKLYAGLGHGGAFTDSSRIETVRRFFDRYLQESDE